MRSTDSAAFQDATAAELIAAAARKRQAVKRKESVEQQRERARANSHSEDDEHEAGPPVRKARRRILRDPDKAVGDEEAAAVVRETTNQDGEAHANGLVTRGVHGGLNGLMLGHAGVLSLGIWGVCAVVAIVTLIVISCYASSTLPEPLPVTAVRVSYVSGPHLPARDINEWLRRFPYIDDLKSGAPWVLDQLAAHLRSQPAVAEVRQVTVVHEPGTGKDARLQRSLELVLRLRQPVLPVLLATGARGWVDEAGWLLPGSLPGPGNRSPPLLRDIEWGGVDGVRTALALWKQLEPLVEPGLISEIDLYDRLDDTGDSRGIVLHTRQGGRLIWGRPGEEKFGVSMQDKVNGLVRTLRCQGDLSRLALVNVRFYHPFFVLRDAQH